MNRLEPRIRFEEFSDEWEKESVKNFSKVIGTGKSKKDAINNGIYPVLGSTGIIGYSNDYDYEDNFVLVARVGANAGSMYHFNGACKISDNTIYIVSNIPHFTIGLLNKFNIKRLVFGTGQPLVKSSELKKLKLFIPKQNEQEKIGDFFEKLDRLIESQESYLELNKKLKKSLLQKLFPKEGEDRPELRFPGFDDKWEIISLKKILEEKVEKTKVNNQHEILSSTRGGIYIQNEYFNNQVASNNNIGYKIIRLNQLVLSPQNLWLGNINLNKKFKIGIVSPSYKIFNIKFEKVSLNFIDKALVTQRMLYNYKIASEQGASVVRRNLNINDFLNIKIKLPILEEQEKIGSLFKSLDEKIESEEKKLRAYKDFKKSMLQKMFV